MIKTTLDRIEGNIDRILNLMAESDDNFNENLASLYEAGNEQQKTKLIYTFEETFTIFADILAEADANQ